MWTDLYNSLTIVPTEEVWVDWRPEDSVLDDFGSSNNIRLPKSYREFVKVFGAGELGGHYRIGSPGYLSMSPAWSPELIEMNQRWHIDDECDAKSNSRSLDFYTSMYYFCETTEGEAIGWNRNETTVPDDPEFRIYIRMRSDTFIPLADTFTDFILNVCLGGGYDRVMTNHGYLIETPSEVTQTFVPAPRPPSATRSIG